MYPRSTIFWHIVLLILLLVISFSDSLEAFYADYGYYDLDDDGKLDVMVKPPRFEYICLIVSLPFLLLMFVVYSLLPELQNMHGYTLRVHVASLFITNVIDFCTDEFPILTTGNYCLLIAYIYNFSRLSSLFWLNVICFDTWWTLRQFRSYRMNLKKQEKKMFIMYSIYAWGLAFILNVVCAILNIPSISKHLSIPPDICEQQAWFSVRAVVYFFVPVSVSVIINICFFIALTLRIWNHGKHTANQLRNSSSNRHNKNMFTIYVKLSVVLGISWIMKIILWLTDSYVVYLANGNTFLGLLAWHIAEVIDIFQGVILFFAFVWKKRIVLLLLKRFGYQIREPVMNISKNNDRPCASSSPTTPLTAEMVPMQEISPSNQ